MKGVYKMSDLIKKTFKFLSKDPGTWNEQNVDKVIEYEDMYVLIPKRKLGNCDGSLQMMIFKSDGSYDVDDFYAERFKRPVIKEYTFAEFERLCS